MIILLKNYNYYCITITITITITLLHIIYIKTDNIYIFKYTHVKNDIGAEHGTK